MVFYNKTSELAAVPLPTEDDSSEEYYLGPFVSDIYNQAFQFKQVLNAETKDKDASPSSTPASTVSEGILPLKQADAFADLVGRDLDKAGAAAAAPFSKLHVAENTWLDDDDGDVHSEPGSIHESDESDDDMELQPPLPKDTDSDAASVLDAPVIQRAATVEMDEPWRVPPEEAIKLLVEEFGPLAQPGETEKLIFEADGVISQDISVMGVLHLTTHRLTFHASLFHPEQANNPNYGVIKAGPVILHRKGLRRKRRIWIELTHEMLCCYRSSSDEDRIRPLRALFLSSIKTIHPMDPKNPRIMRLSVMGTHDQVGYSEFDTVESSAEWRRELTSALFLYRHRRRKVLQKGDEEDEDGMRLSIPLDRLLKVEFGINPQIPRIALFHIQLPDTSGIHRLVFNKNPKVMLMQMGPVQQFDKWQELPKYVDKARSRMKTACSTAPLIIDTGPLLFSETDDEEEEGGDEKVEAIRHAIGLSKEDDLWITKARTAHLMADRGYFVISNRFIGLWSQSTRYRIETSQIRKAKPYDSKILRSHAVVLELFAHQDIRFDFCTAARRDEAVARINQVVCPNGVPVSPTTPASLNGSDISSTKTLKRKATSLFSPLSRTYIAATTAQLPLAYLTNFPRKVINLPRGTHPPRPAMKFVCLTIGSRGDVQPYIALGLGLKKEGHSVIIVTHDEYKEWIENFGLEHRQAGGDPGALMKLSVENKIFSPEFFRESLRNFRPWLDQLLKDAWEACQDADVLLESPSAMAGVHIAEALNIPYFRTFTMPWTKTSEFPHAFISPPVDAPAFNATTYVLFENVMWTATSGQINRWRKNTLKIAATDMGHLAQSKITFIYNFSQAVVPKPLDWGDATIISGYWFLDNPDFGWTPPNTLLEFMKKARVDGKPLVYIGFGSITVPHPNLVTARIVQAVVKSGCRAIISKGWSARMAKDDKDPEATIPPECYMLDKVPHDWLFPQIDAAMHHGGAGTTGASLRAGIPTLIKPWFGDQFFWATRVQKLGAGLRVPSLGVNDIADSLIKATSSRTMKEKASRVGERIRSEDGVTTAIEAIYTYFNRASKDRYTLEKEKSPVRR